MTIVLWKLLFTWCEADSSLFALVISFLCSAVIVTFSTLSRLMPIFFLCLFSGVRTRWGEKMSLAGDPTPPIHQPGDYFQHPLQNVKASLSRRRVHHLLSKTFPRVSIKTHKHIMCHYFLLPVLPFCRRRATRVSECSWVGCVLCKREALFENYRMWQDPFSVAEITLYG